MLLMTSNLAEQRQQSPPRAPVRAWEPHVSSRSGAQLEAGRAAKPRGLRHASLYSSWRAGRAPWLQRCVLPQTRRGVGEGRIR